mmetsp:Transcript_10/g.25  ORF Transcript_10/g.25 Transcript_10/m.25 type:complete len:154 (+) Transcript_10:206-667(+)
MTMMQSTDKENMPQDTGSGAGLPPPFRNLRTPTRGFRSLAWEYKWFGMQQIDCHSADMSTVTVTADDSDDDEPDAYNRIHDAETTSGMETMTLACVAHSNPLWNPICLTIVRDGEDGLLVMGACLILETTMSRKPSLNPTTLSRMKLLGILIT